MFDHRKMRQLRRLPRGLTAALVLPLLSSSAALAAPEKGRDLYVLQLASAKPLVRDAIRLTKALETRVASFPAVQFVNTNKALIILLREAKCAAPFSDLIWKDQLVRSGDDRLVDAACLQALAPLIDTPPADRYLWGLLAADDAGRLQVTVHVWERGQNDHAVTFPYDADADLGGAGPERLAQRIVLRLLTPAQVGDVSVVAQGAVAPVDLTVDGVAQGRGLELTLAAGAHTFAVRDAAGATWRGRGDVVAGLLRVVPLTRQTADAASVPASSAAASRPVWPWVVGAVGLAGLAGYGLLQLGPKRSAERDLADGCAGNDCPAQQQDARDRASRVGAWSAVSFGVGVVGLLVGGAGLLWPAQSSSQPARLTGSATPLRGGASLQVEGSF